MGSAHLGKRHGVYNKTSKNRNQINIKATIKLKTTTEVTIQIIRVIWPDYVGSCTIR